MKIYRRSLRLWLAFAMMLILTAALHVQAASDIIQVDCPKACITYTKSTIDPELDTSLNITKYNYSGVGIPSDGQYTGDIPEGATPLQGVVFKYYKVADLVHSDGEPIAALKYNLQNQQIASVLGLVPGLYTSDQLIDALNGANEDETWRAMLEQVVDRRGTAMEPTDEEGKTSAQGVEQGLYLVIESEVPGDVYERTLPFFVSLPMTNAGTVADGETSYEPGTLWQYDVYVYPKNKAEAPEIQKNIVDGQEREKYGSAGVGDVVTYEIKSQIPEGVDTMSRYAIMDQMSAGLTFQAIQSVRVGTVEIPIDRLHVDTQAEGRTFAIEFITDNENQLEGHGGEEIIVTYTAILNENCIVTSEGNPNHATLAYNYNAGIYDNSQDASVEDVADPRVYTYGIDLTKENVDGDPLAGVEFELYEADKTTKIPVTQRASTNQTYAGVNSYYPNAEGGADTITTDANGRAYIWGLAPGTYYLKETKTAEGYNLQKEMVEITIQEDVSYTVESETRAGTYAQIPETNVPVYYKLETDGTYRELESMASHAGAYVNFSTNKIYTMNGQGEYEKVTMYYPVVTASVEAAEPFGTSDMNVVLTMLNTMDFDLPLTGGMGTYILTISGAVLVFAALLLLVRKKRNAAR